MENVTLFMLVVGWLMVLEMEMTSEKLKDVNPQRFDVSKALSDQYYI